jgi:uncharacterized protein YndB with AHSA1/START domain
MMTIGAVDRIDRTIDIKAAPEEVWRALTTGEELAAWFRVTIEGTIAPDAVVWMTSKSPGYEGQRFSVHIKEMTPPRRFVWEWHPGVLDHAVDYSRESPTTVTFTLEPSPTGTRLSVSETGFDQIPSTRRAKVHEDNSQGWTQVLVWVQEHVEAAR